MMEKGDRGGEMEKWSGGEGERGRGGRGCEIVRQSRSSAILDLLRCQTDTTRTNGRKLSDRSDERTI